MMDLNIITEKSKRGLGYTNRPIKTKRFYDVWEIAVGGS